MPIVPTKKAIYTLEFMIKAVFFDIDGTLVSFNTHKVPESTIYALKELKRKGIKTFIATGRSWNQITRLDDDFPVFDGYITLNGSCCMTADKEIIYKNCIPAEDLTSLEQFHKTCPFPIEFVYDDHETMTEADEAVAKMWDKVNIPVPPIIPMEESPKENVFQLGLFLNKEKEAQLKVVERFMPHCESMRWSPDFYDVVPKGSKKSIGIDKVIAHYGIKLEETMTFGDGGNDIDMIRHAAIGVAMGNAFDDVKQHADYVTEPIDDDGVLKALQHFKIIE